MVRTHGLAKASAEAEGKRPRTVYSITAKGRRALATWIRTDSSGPSLEMEPLIKVFFAEHGSRDDLLRTIEGLRESAAARTAQGAGISRTYLEGGGQFPERLPWLILVGQFIQEFNELVFRWSDWAAETVEAWPAEIRSAEPDWATLEDMAAREEASPA
jgi:PadR family transcriptional regulator, regulatory protein AphA